MKNIVPEPLLPDLVIVSRQRAVCYGRERLSAIVRAALPACVAVSRRLGGPLAGLRAVECSVVGSRAMAKIHRKFLNERGATDVITFPYGEIVVCATVAASRAPEFGHTVTDELALYCIHGLLHLAGHDDLRPADAEPMQREQEKILKSARKSAGRALIRT
ncbi:MAG: rRNA maturation RNase YbeY [Verrucomicrobiae bacterium]